MYFFYIAYLTFAYGPKCRNNPWTNEQNQDIAPGLEWVLPSPPAFHTFGDQLPVIRPTGPAQLILLCYILFIVLTKPVTGPVQKKRKKKDDKCRQ